MNIFNVERQFRWKKEKKWDYLYWAIDLHDCVIPGTYTRMNEGKTLYPHAKEVLLWLTSRQDMISILWTPSHTDAIANVLEWLAGFGIMFDHLNNNPDVPS